MNYRPLYSLRIEHDYFDRGVCRALRCRIAPAEAGLWHRRGLLLRQPCGNEWTVLYDSDGAGVDTASDVLALEMDMTDPAFVLYTQWEGFQPDAAYSLELPSEEETADAANAIRRTASGRGIGSGFCKVRIRLTEKLLQAAREGRAESCTLRFRAPECRWEYLLVPRAGDTVAAERYLLEEADGKLHFPPFEPELIYGRELLRTISEESIPMRERYGYRLRVVAPAGSGGRKQTILRHLAPPEPGRFLDAARGVLRQVGNL